MTLHISGSAAPWLHLCRADVLAFRAACNSVAKPDDQPVKKSFVERISCSVEAEPVFLAAWMRAAENGSRPIVESFFEYLMRDPAWSTLVLEALARERRWFAAKGGGVIAKLWERMLALVEKILDRNSHPVARVFVMTLTSTSVVTGAIALLNALGPLAIRVTPVLPTGKVSIPVSLVPTLDPGGASVPVAVQLSGFPTQIPVQLVNSEDSPAQIHLDASMRSLQASAEVLTHQLTGVSGLLQRNVSYEPNFLAGLRQIGQEVHTFANDYKDEAQAGRLTAEQVMPRLNASLAAIAGLVSTGQVFSQQRQVTLRPYSSISMLLPRFDPAAPGDSFVEVNVCTRAVKHARHDAFAEIATWVSRVSGTKESAGTGASGAAAREKPCHGAGFQKYWLGSEAQSLVAPWGMILNSIDGHWNGGDSVTLTLTPDPGVAAGSMTAGRYPTRPSIEATHDSSLSHQQ